MNRQIDLLPASVHQRTNRGTRTGRFVASIVVGLAVVVVTFLHARFDRDVQRNAFDRARGEANAVIDMENRIEVLRSELIELDAAYDRYRTMVPSIDLGDLTATLVNHLPPNAALDRLDLNTAGRRNARSARDRSSGDRVGRYLTIELSGFAPDDRIIAEYVDALQNLDAFEYVTLDFSRTRVVRDRAAREFRISLRLNLDHSFETRLTAAGDPS